MSLADGKLIDADIPDLADVRVCIVMLKVVLVDVLHRVPAQLQVCRDLADGHQTHQVNHKPLQPMRRVPLTRGEGNVFLVLAASGMAFYTLDAHVDVDWFPAQGNTSETTDSIPVSYNSLTSALRTAKFIAPSLHIQNNSIIFVLCSGALDCTETESVIHKADVHTFYSL
jgi:hypothetical protein